MGYHSARVALPTEPFSLQNVGVLAGESGERSVEGGFLDVGDW